MISGGTELVIETAAIAEYGVDVLSLTVEYDGVVPYLVMRLGSPVSDKTLEGLHDTARHFVPAVVGFKVIQPIDANYTEVHSDRLTEKKTSNESEI